MNWELLLAGGAFGITLTGAIATCVNYIIKLQVEPIRKDLDTITKVVENVKTESELETMMDLRIAKHKDNCIPAVHSIIDRRCKG